MNKGNISDPLHSFRAKLARAREHLDVLETEISSFVENPQAYSVRKDAHPERGVYEFRLQIPCEPPMDRWALMIGDCIHNARSALDHLFWQLVLLQHPAGNPAKHWKAGFPVYDVVDRFNKRQIEYFVGTAATAIIERLQPFNSTAPHRDAFNFLHKQDITDKHRLLVPSVGFLRTGQIKTTQRFGVTPHMEVKRFLQQRLHNDAVLATVVVPPEDVVDVNLISLRLGIVFATEGEKTIMVTTGLADLIDTVRAVPELFRAFFPAR